MKIDLNWIQKELDAGREVELECVDREGLAKLTPYVDGLISQEPLTIESWCSDYLYLNINKKKCYQATLSKEELKYFRIKRSTMTFKDLINVAVQAVEDELIVVDFLNNHKIVLHQIKHTEFITFKSLLDVEKGIDFINSLYTETFVIESEEDIDRVNADAVIVLSNGSELTAIVTKRKDSIEFSSLGVLYFYILKGATVTQKRGDYATR